MSNIEPNIIDPAKGPPVPPPDSNPDLPGYLPGGPDEVREPASDIPPIEPDPEEGGRRVPDDIERL